MGLAGTAVIAAWSFGLVKSAGAVLLDTLPAPEIEREVRDALEVAGDRLSDLHLWQVGPPRRRGLDRDGQSAGPVSLQGAAR